MSIRYVYQLIQALDDKIGPDLRGVVEQYLGPDRLFQLARHRFLLEDMVKSPWWPQWRTTFADGRRLDLMERIVDKNPYAKQIRLMWQGRQLWSHDRAYRCVVWLEEECVHLKVTLYPSGQHPEAVKHTYVVLLKDLTETRIDHWQQSIARKTV